MAANRKRRTGAHLDPVDLAAWRGLLRVHTAVVAELDAELRQAHGLPLTSYDVLLHLAWAPGGRLRMGQLADAVLLSRSGLSRLVDELERAGLLARERCEDDARGLEAVLTRSGRTKLRAANATHLDGVHRLFLDRLTLNQRRALAETWRAVHPPAVEVIP